ncbi:cadherin-like and PC-esterase domain-containing protein 1 isoform X1 [Scyliorhinus canicula]|uniref:cadherin-like and PC-esterase domain-containing protein 1 isoform X1 n=1 Tax=Scyliorhinus canicula TaxID=7830 RepID=UPI0018F63938|nr:cadherin-like and PC-esterase domain-containing protein 1 isoform X1 [Scyliorhinus canicula]
MLWVRQTRLRCRPFGCPPRPLVLVAAIGVCLVYPTLTVLRLRAGTLSSLLLSQPACKQCTQLPGNGEGASERDTHCLPGPTGLDQLLQLIQIEPEKSNAFNNRKKTVVLRGYNSISVSDLRLYQHIFVQYGYELVLSPDVDGGSSYKEGFKDNGAGHWDLLICFTSNELSGDRCLQKEEFHQLQLHQKVNRIPGLEHALCRKDGFCQIMDIAQRLPVRQPLVLPPLCFNHYVELKTTSNRIGVENSFPPLKLEATDNERDVKQFSAFSERPQTIPMEGLSAILKVYVLVTSLSPLRAFIHSTGLVQSEPNKKFFVTKLRAYFEKYFGATTSAQAFENMKELITQLLLIAEVNIESSSQGPSGTCCSCFQLLAFDLSFGASAYPVVVEVHQQPVFEADDSIAFADRITKDFILEDTFRLLLSGTSVVSEIYDALENIRRSVRLKNHSHFQKRELCLTSRDLTAVINFHKEFKNQGRFELLYPSINPDYQRILYALYHNFEHSSKRKWVLLQHWLFSELLDQFQAPKLERSLSHFTWEQSPTIPPHIIEKLDNGSKLGQPRQRNCSTGKHTLAYITHILTSPQLNLNPVFTPKIKVYYSEVPFDVVIVKIRTEAANCHCRVHLDERQGPSIANYPLGLGNNRIHILVSDESRAQPTVIATYTVNVYRHSQPSLPAFDGSIMCSFVQDCGLIIRPSESCGLQPVSSSSFSAVAQTQLLNCKAGDAKGQWVIPCLSCSDNQTCDWQKARWQPDECQYLTPTKSQLQQCMYGRRVLFIGDSTNRGMMYYLMEEVNETLQEWDKAHDTKFYSNLNGGKTFTSYAYYPQFWLSLNRRPTFERTLEQLIQRSRPLENNDQTVLVVGGVQWLNTRHLHIMQKVLQRENLLNILVIIKSIGMGFHLPVDGIRSLSLNEVQNLWKENTEILSQAKNYGYDVIDTFSITMGRYKEFLQGKCACHFHEVDKFEFSQSTMRRKLRHSSHPFVGKRNSSHNKQSLVQDFLSVSKLHYRVNGPVNQAYSEIFLSRVCVNRLTPPL